MTNENLMNSKETNNIFLIGPMGAGKTSVGKLLAKILNYQFYDSDQVIEEQSGADIPWIFDIEGEEGFRRREIKAIDDLTKKQDIVLATGGGVILKKENRQHLATRGKVFFLKVSVEEQVKRTCKSRNRPLILNTNALETFDKLKKEREPLYYSVADYIIDTDHGSIRGIVKSILEKI
jgi:shikimate kinase